MHQAKEYFRSLQAEALREGHTIPSLLTERYGKRPEDLAALKARMIRVIPWNRSEGYLSMLQQPKQSAKQSRMSGRVHISMLSFTPTAFHGSGLYADDVVDAMELFYTPRPQPVSRALKVMLAGVSRR